MKLIPLSEYVLHNEIRMSNPELFKSKVYAYANFLRQPLTLGMFVPVDEKANPYDLKEVEAWKNHEHYSRHYKEELAFFEDGCEKVLFKGFKVDRETFRFKWGVIKFFIYAGRGIEFYGITYSEVSKYTFRLKTIEDLANLHDMPLTPSALKLIGKE